MLIDSLAVRTQTFSLAVLLSAAAQFSFFCLKVPNDVDPKFFQRDHEFHPPPTAVAAVLILRIPWGFLQATNSNDIGKGGSSSKLFAHAVAYRETVQRGMAVAEGSSEISEQPLVALCNTDVSNWKCSEVDCHPRGLLAKLAAMWWGVGVG